MNIVRHPGYLEVAIPEFFDLVHRPDKLVLSFSAFQGGQEKLLLDLCQAVPTIAAGDHDRIAHFTQSLLHALESMRDSVAMLAFVTRKDKLPALQPYVDQLEANGYEARLFSDPQKARMWLGH